MKRARGSFKSNVVDRHIGGKRGNGNLLWIDDENPSVFTAREEIAYGKELVFVELCLRERFAQIRNRLEFNCICILNTSVKV